MNSTISHQSMSEHNPENITRFYAAFFNYIGKVISTAIFLTELLKPMSARTATMSKTRPPIFDFFDEIRWKRKIN